MNGHKAVIVAAPASPKKSIAMNGEWEVDQLHARMNNVSTVTAPATMPAKNPAIEFFPSVCQWSLFDRLHKGMPTKTTMI